MVPPIMTLDLECFRLPADMTAPAQPTQRPPRHKAGQRFLKGPIPWDWLERAMELRGKALHVALVIWREAGWRKHRTVPLCLRGPLPAGLNEWSARRGVRSLESAGLVTIGRKPGHGLEVTLLDVSSTAVDGP